MRFGTVIFDCDSTLASLEGIDELAGDSRARIEELTDRAMRGEVPLEQVYGQRLAICRPNRDAVAALGRRYVTALVPDARQTVASLRAEGITVRILSAGLLPAVLALSDALGIPRTDVAAVDVRFDDTGAYAGFDESSPLARAGGKRRVVAQWAPELPTPIMMVGDGVTDLEVKPIVQQFVAFAGVVSRPAVVDAADVVIRARSLASVLPLALGGEPPSDPRFHELFDRGRALLWPQAGSEAAR